MIIIFLYSFRHNRSSDNILFSRVRSGFFKMKCHPGMFRSRKNWEGGVNDFFEKFYKLQNFSKMRGKMRRFFQNLCPISTLKPIVGTLLLSPENNFDETVVKNSPIVEHLFDPSFYLYLFGYLRVHRIKKKPTTSSSFFKLNCSLKQITHVHQYTHTHTYT